MSLRFPRLSALVGIVLVLSAAFVLPLPRLAASRDRDRAVRVTRGGPQRPGSGCPSHASDDLDLPGLFDDGCMAVTRVGVAASASPIPVGILISVRTLARPSFTLAHVVPDVLVGHAARPLAPSRNRAPPAA